MNIWIWVTAGVVSAFSIVFVWMIFYFLVPMKNSPARHFVKAKRDKKPIFLLDAGKIWRCVVGDQKIGSEKAQIFRHGQDIIKGDQGLKYCEGVMIGVAEDFRSLLVNVGIVDLMDMINKKDWEPSEIQERLNKIAENLKKDLGFTDEFQALEADYNRDIKAINDKFGYERAGLIKNYRVPDEALQNKEENHGTGKLESRDLPGGSEEIEIPGEELGEGTESPQGPV
jgi:hypothetical protein